MQQLFLRSHLPKQKDHLVSLLCLTDDVLHHVVVPVIALLHGVLMLCPCAYSEFTRYLCICLSHLFTNPHLDVDCQLKREQQSVGLM